MRSGFVPPSCSVYLLRFAAPATLAVVGVLGACADDSTTSAETARNGGASPGAGSDSQGEPVPNETIGDSAPPRSDEYRGSPLCHITPATCDPDDESDCTASDASVTFDPKACRITGTTAVPSCKEANPDNTDGAKCQSGSDCAPGFDCVLSNDVGYCRRYCCSGSCGTHRSQNGNETFCDVQKLQGSMAKAPVCMPIKSCKLFLAGECADNETCSVVTDDGTTGCVANGSANAGDSCDQEHCNVGLTCLGQAGNRKCFQLCRTTKVGPSCAPNQICKTSTIFTDPSIGVCAPAQ